MRELAHTDPLTGLANRREFDLRLDEEIAKADGAGRFAIALLDLNGFKPINDRHGHAIGDGRSAEHTSELQSLMRITYAVFCLKKKQTITQTYEIQQNT